MFCRIFKTKKTATTNDILESLINQLHRDLPIDELIQQIPSAKLNPVLELALSQKEACDKTIKKLVKQTSQTLKSDQLVAAQHLTKFSMRLQQNTSYFALPNEYGMAAPQLDKLEENANQSLTTSIRKQYLKKIIGAIKNRFEKKNKSSFCLVQ